MRNRSKRLAGLVAVAAASLLVASACGSGGGNQQSNEQQFSPGFAECVTKPNDCNSGPRKQGGTMIFAVEQAMAAWHVNAAEGTHFSSSQMLSGIIPSPFTAFPDLTLHLNEDLVSSAEVKSESPFTVEYKIRPEAVWSDGTPITAEDFKYNWYTFDGEKGHCPTQCTPASTSGYDLIKDITDADNGKTVTVVFNEPFPDWKGLFALYPAHIAKSKGGWSGQASDAEGLGKSFRYFIDTQMDWSGGPYIIQSYEKGVSLTQVPNPKWYGKDKPTLDKLIWRLVEDQTQLVPAMRNGEINAHQAQPNQQLVQQTAELSNVQYQLASGLQWEHFDFNTKSALLSDKAVRQAIATAVDRQEIIDKTVGLFSKETKPLNNHVLMNGQKGYKDNIQGSDLGSGNINAAKKILTDAGYKIEGGKLITKAGTPAPSIRFRHTVGNTLRANTAQIFQQEMKELGIDVKIETTDSLSKTLDQGDYDMIIFAWVSSPTIGTTLQDLWSTGSGQNYNSYSNPEFDRIAKEVAKTVDEQKQLDLINQGDKILMDDVITLPLFQKPAMVAVTKDFVNVRSNPTNGGVAYNNQQWGLKAA